MSVIYGFKAEDVIAEGRITRHQIEAIHKWRRSENVPELNDEQIVNFVLSCDGDLEFTMKTIKEFYKARQNAPELFTNRDIAREELQLQLRTVEFCVMPNRTDEGCAVVYHKLYDHSYSKYNMGPSMKLLFMTLDSAIHTNPPTGLIILFDMKGVGLGHLTKVRINLVSTFCHYLQEGLPVKLKEIHVLNSVYFMDKVMVILKPFLNKKMYELLFFHSPNIDMEAFYDKYIPRKCLPVDYGGELPDTRILHKENIKKLEELKPFFDAEEKQRKMC